MNKKEKKTSYLFYDFIKVTAAIPGLVWLRTKKIYATEKAKEKIKGGALLISNHSGDYDPIILMFGIGYRRHHFIATADLFNTKAKRFWFEQFHCIEIDKQNVSMKTFREIIDHLQQDKLVCMFPEGQVARDDEMKKFKSGMVLMSVTAKKPIIPVYIKKRKSIWERQRVVIGEPINPMEMFGRMPSLAEMDQIANLLREKEEELKQLAEK